MKLVAGNWKMHGSLSGNAQLLAGIGAHGVSHGVEIAVCVPSVYLQQVCGLLSGSGIALGAQNVSEHESGAFTGEVSVAMLKELGCCYVIVGHSERRALFGETSRQVTQKLKACLSGGLRPILCVGETSAEREAGTTEVVIAGQLDAVLSEVGPEQLAEAVVAYEPVWAIGTGKTATPEQAQDVHAFIRTRLAKAMGARASEVRILYGGSVKAANAAALFACPDIDGGLVGGASLQAQEFLAICRAAE